MDRKETNYTNRRGKHIHDISAEATRMIIQRINLQNLNLRLDNLPLCCPENADNIEGFLPRAKDGFALSLKANQVKKNELSDLLRETTPLAYGGNRTSLTLKEADNTLPEFGHVLATISELLRLGKISFTEIKTVYPDVSYDLGNKQTYWYLNTDSVGELWSLMGKIENITRQALYQQKKIPTESLLTAGHFFAISKKLSVVFDEIN